MFSKRIIILIILLAISVSFSMALKVGIYNNPPLVYYDKITKTPRGIFTDILKYIANKNGWDLVYVYEDWQKEFQDLKDGKLDVLLDVAYSKDREKYISYSDITVVSNWGVIYRSKRNKIPVSNIFDLKNKKIAVVDDIYYSFLKKEAFNFGINIDFDVTKSYSKAFEALNDGKVDFALADRYFAVNYAFNYHNIEKTTFLFSPVQLRFAFRKNIDKDIIKIINQDLEKLMKTKNSFYYKVIKEYTFRLPKSSNIPSWIYTFMMTAIVLLIVLLAVIYFLRMIIRSKTEEIRNKNKELLKQREELESSYQEMQAMNEELQSSYSELTKYTEKLNRIYSILSEIGYRNADVEKLAEQLLKLAMELIEEADTGSISIDDKGTWKFLATVGHNKDLLNNMNLPAKYFIKMDKVTLIDNIVSENKTNMPKELFEQFEKATVQISKCLIAPIKIGDGIYGNISVDMARNSDKNFSKMSFRIIDAIAAIGSSFLTMNNYAKLQGELQKDVILTLIRLMEIFDPYTEGHSEYVAEHSSDLAQLLGFSKDKVKLLYWSGLLHDIGKVGIPRNVLNKPGRLTDEEYDLIKQHPVFGYELLTASKKLKDLAIIVRHHHERYDGKGYPDGLKGEDIPFESRIITVVDSWHAMRSDRVYRKGLSFKIAREEIVKGLGTQFDPEIGKAFLKLIDKGKTKF